MDAIEFMAANPRNELMMCVCDQNENSQFVGEVARRKAVLCFLSSSGLLFITFAEFQLSVRHLLPPKQTTARR